MEATDRGLTEVLEVGQHLDQEGEEEVEARHVQKEKCRCIKGRESGDGASCDSSNTLLPHGRHRSRPLRTWAGQDPKTTQGPDLHCELRL